MDSFCRLNVKCICLPSLNCPNLLWWSNVMACGEMCPWYRFCCYYSILLPMALFTASSDCRYCFLLHSLNKRKGVLSGPRAGWAGGGRVQLQQTANSFLKLLNNQFSRCEEAMRSSVREGDRGSFSTVSKVVSDFNVPRCGRGTVGSGTLTAAWAGFPTSRKPHMAVQECENAFHPPRTPAAPAYLLTVHK